MSGPLYRWLVRRAARGVGAWVVLLACYEWLLIWIYPSIARNHALSAVMAGLPRGLVAAFGLGGGSETLAVFLSSEFFSFIWILGLAGFAAVEAARLPAGMLERGQLTPLLLTPTSRRGVVVAAAAALLTEILALDALSLLAAALLAAVYGVSRAGVDFGLLGLGSFVLLAFLAMVALAASCLLADERSALGVAGGIGFIFYVLDFAARLSPRLSGLTHLTPFALYRPEALLAGHAPLGGLAGLALAAAGLLALAAEWFSRLDLRMA